MAYNKPPKDEMLFNFTGKAYTAPDFNDVNFRFTSQISDLKAQIIGAELDRDYLKSCQEYVIGYNQNNLQILRTDCVYGGIRDLQVYLDVLSHFVDLPTYLKQTYAGQADVTKALKGWAKATTDIDNTIKGWFPSYIDLQSYIKQGYADDVDLPVYLKQFTDQQEDLRNTVKGWSTGNIVDIINTIRIWHEDIKDIPAYLKTTIQDDVDLPTIVYKIWQHQQEDLNKALHGWQEAQLQKLIRAFHTFDLPVAVRSTYFDDLSGWLYAIQPVDIKGDIQAWAYGDLPAYISDGPHPGDFPASIFGVGPLDLKVRLYAKQGVAVPFDLNARTTNFAVSNLLAALNIIQYSDLQVLLTSSMSFSDLLFKIYPKLVNVKHHIKVAFLEHRDLAGIVNFPCFSSAFRDLSISLVIKNSKDMKFYIYGTDYSNIVDLRCTINASDYLSTDTINVRYFNDKLPETITTLSYEKKPVYYSFNTIVTWTNTFTKSIADLGAAITGDYLTKDLPVFIRAYSNFHYMNSTNNIRETLVTLKLKDNKEDFRRYVDITFNSYANKYTYFSGNQRAYRNFKNDHWVVRVEGHQLLPVGRGFEKSHVRRKYIFNLKNYESIDEAIRDMIDRVTALRHTDLGVFIECTNDRVANLSAYLRPKRIYKSNRVLGESIRGVMPSLTNLPTVLIGELHKGTINLTTNITGLEYVSSSDGVVDFEFTGAGDTLPAPTDADFVFDLGDEYGDN